MFISVLAFNTLFFLDGTKEYISKVFMVSSKIPSTNFLNAFTTCLQEANLQIIPGQIGNYLMESPKMENLICQF